MGYKKRTKTKQKAPQVEAVVVKDSPVAEVPEQIAVPELPPEAPSDEAPAETRMVEDLIADSLASVQGVEGTNPIRTNPDKFTGCLVNASDDQMLTHQGLGVYFPKKGDRDKDDEPLVLNEDSFSVDMNGNLRFGSCIVGVRRKAVHDELRRREKRTAEESRGDAAGSPEGDQQAVIEKALADAGVTGKVIVVDGGTKGMTRP